MDKINILVIDDNTYVGNNIKQRIISLDRQALEKKSSKPKLHIDYIDGNTFNYYNFENDSSLITEVSNKLQGVNYLLLDLYYQEHNTIETDKIENKEVIISVDVEKSKNINWELVNGNLNDDAKKYLQTFAKKSSELFQKLSTKDIEKLKKTLKGVIIYTYSPNPSANSLAEKSEIIINALNIDPNLVEIFSSHQELYQSTDFELYKTKRISPTTVSIGQKCDYSLYGSVLGEILYHKLIDKELGRHREDISIKKKSFWSKIPIYYLMFASIGFGGNALFDLLHSDKGVNSLSILIISILTGIIIPLLVLTLKPELLISQNDVEK